MDPFLISEQRLSELAATRQGRVSLAGFNYQAGYAVARLASMLVRRPILDLPDFPLRLRYDWGEDLDEACENGRVVFTQCKRVDSIGQPAKLVDVLESFAAKWLFVAADKRSLVHFRLVSTDPRFAAHGLFKDSASLSKKECRKHFTEALAAPAGVKSDRALWQAAADAFGHELLFEALWERCEGLFLPAGVITGYPASPLLQPEQKGLELLLSFSQVDPSMQEVALSRLRRLVHDNLITFDPCNEAPAALPQHQPRHCERVDVANALAACAFSTGAAIPFDVVDRTFLGEQREKEPRQFVARQPDWADVVHGADETVKFVERSITQDMRAKVVSELIEPLERGSERRLHLLFVTGAPGSGKTTLVRRVAALLVEEGRIVVADPGVDAHEPSATPDEYFTHLERLAAMGRPVILLLDDPLYGGSPWVEVLRKLNRPTLRIAVLAPSPQMLFDMHRNSITFGVVRHHGIGAPTESERAEMKRLWGRDSSALLSSDEFLVITMEAAANLPFDEIMRRLWQTLNDGNPMPDDWETAAWPLRAFLIVAFFHRAYAGCPEPLLRTVLSSGSNGRPATNVKAELARLKSRDGWLMFRFNEHEQANWAYQGTLIYAAHQRIAQRAWELRPFDWIDVGSMIVEASVSVPQSIWQLGTLAARLLASGNETDRGFAAQLVDEWCREEHQSKFETRYLGEFVSALQTNSQRQIALRFKTILTVRAQSSSEAWIAALVLCYLSGDAPAEQSYPAELDLTAAIACADFAVAPSRAVRFFSRLPDQVKPVFTRRILDAFDGHLSWSPDSFLIGWLLVSVSPREMLKRAEQIEIWLRGNPDDTNVRTGYLALISKHGVDKEHLDRVMTETEQWLRGRQDDSEVRVGYLALISKHGVDKEHLDRVIADTEQWISDHVDNSSVRTGYLALISKWGVDKDHLNRVIDDTEKWIKDHPADVNVRRVYLAFLSKQTLNQKQWERAIADVEEWLRGHSGDVQLRASYLELLSKRDRMRDVREGQPPVAPARPEKRPPPPSPVPQKTSAWAAQLSDYGAKQNNWGRVPTDPGK